MSARAGKMPANTNQGASANGPATCGVLLSGFEKLSLDRQVGVTGM